MSEHKQYDFNPSIFMRVFECTMIVFTYIYYYYKHEKSINMKKDVINAHIMDQPLIY